MLIEKEKYLSAGANIGTRRRVEDMKPFIYRVKKNKLAIIDLEKTDNRIEIAGKFLARYEPEDILVISRKEIGQKPVVKFSEATGAENIYGRFMPGTLTNPNNDDFQEPKIVVITDPIEDSQAADEATDARIPVVSLCDTVNKLDYIDYAIPCNNKGRKSLALVYYLLAREYLKNRGEIESDEDFDYEIEDFEADESVEEESE